MYIARRTGGGRGVYEIAGQTSKGFSARDVANRELFLDLLPYAYLKLGLKLHIQGGKPRLVLLNRTLIHVQRQMAAILLLPKPIRADSGMGNLLPAIRTDKYAIERLDMEKVVVEETVLRFSPGILELKDTGQSLAIPFLGRFGQVVNLWRNKSQFPPPISKLLEEHENIIVSGNPLTQKAEDLVKDIQSFSTEYSQITETNFAQDMDSVPFLLSLLSSVDNLVIQAELPLAEEVESTHASTLFEGATKKISVNAYERNPIAREQCIAYYGAKCSVCNLDFSRVYGSIGSGYIHVHHLKPLSSMGESYQVDPINDLCPVCPNCHAMLHKKNPPYTIDELKQILNSGPYG